MEPTILAYCIAVIFGGAIVRGYTGFGSSLIWVSGLSLVLPPVAVVPTTYVLEVAASIHLLPKVWREIDWRSLRWLLLGTFVATPLGLALLTSLPAAPIRAAIAVVVLAATASMWRGFALKATPGPASTFVTGLVCGLFKGGVGIGGPPAILFYFSTPAAVAVSRASLIAFFLAIGTFAFAAAAVQDLFTIEVMIRTVLFVPPVLIGIALGNRQFVRTDPERFRRYVFVVLAVLSVAVLLRALLG